MNRIPLTDPAAVIPVCACQFVPDPPRYPCVLDLVRALSVMVARLAWPILAALALVLTNCQTTGAQTFSTDDLVPIYAIQGADQVSPMAGQWIDTMGKVTAVTSDGFYLQDPQGDGDASTSDGIFVYTHRPPTVTAGDCVVVTRALVDEFYEKTELSRSKPPTAVDACPPAPISPVSIQAARLGQEPADQYERFEGMLVALDNVTGTVQGPTKRFRDGEAEIAFVSTPLIPYLEGERVFQHNAQDTAALMFVSSALGLALPDLNWGDAIALGPEPGAVDAVTGVLDFNFGKYQFMPLPDQTIVSTSRVPGPDQAPAPAEGFDLGARDEAEFTVCSYNLLGFGRGSAQYAEDDAYAAQMQKRSRAITERLGGCTVIGLQEAGTPADAQALAEQLTASYGLPYAATAIPGPYTANEEFPLTNAFLTRTDRVTVLDAEAHQGCTGYDYGVADYGVADQVVAGQIVGGQDVTDGESRTPPCPPGTHPLFNRPPLRMTLILRLQSGQTMLLTVITNHWKSKAGDETVNAVRRQAQAEHVADLVQALLDVDADANVIVLGDLNDYWASEPIETLRQDTVPPLVHTFDFLPVLDRYTYIYNGASQVLDHALISPSLLPALAEVRLLRLNADFAYPLVVNAQHVQHSSDHDPILLRFRPESVAWLGGELAYGGITVTVRDNEGAAIAVTTTDANGSFRLWNLRPGRYTVTLDAPDGILLDQNALLVALRNGENRLPRVVTRHEAIELGVQAAQTALDLAAQSH